MTRERVSECARTHPRVKGTRARATSSRTPRAMRGLCLPACALPSARVARTNAKSKAKRALESVASPTIVVKDGNDRESTMKGLTATRRAVIEDLSAFASGELSGLLKDPEKNWQPQDFLPDPESADFLDQVRGRRRDGWGNAEGRSFIQPRRTGVASMDARCSHGWTLGAA